MDELHEILTEIRSGSVGVDETQVETLGARLLQAPRVFVAGAGRTGLMVKSFAMRLMHLGRTVFAAGETITPAITPRDLLLAASCSGSTVSVLEFARRAKSVGAAVFALTSADDSPLAKLADGILLLPAGRSGVQFGNSLYEQVLLIVLDALVLHLQRALHAPSDEMAARHANLE